MTREFVRASRLRADGYGPQAQREGYWASLAERAPKGDACEVCGADGDGHDVRRVYLPNRPDAERVPLCASCRDLWGDAL
ncbi:hypothetical protein GCM10009037_06870 [Halarchaeum grantii]|uniref:Uncharacterized protein n=1 Tax=Halarchaeum grantii TaxID=1193105 RepID=A0A830EZW6_9EURY|nr:hypothetical protein [Halarchaeum grantii]GGL25875.1 hypothetical protein GCM10009037_06870 [Halarchaeum grantii]